MSPSFDHPSIRLPDCPRVELTLRCNRNCPYCTTLPAKNPPAEISGAEWLRILQALPTRGAVLSGGEPTLHRDFAWLVNSYRGHLILYSNIDTDVAPDWFCAGHSWTVTCHHRTVEAAIRWAEKVKTFWEKGHRMTPVALAPSKEILAATESVGVKLRKDPFIAGVTGKAYMPAIPGKVLCHHYAPLFGPDGNRWHCTTKMADGDPSGILAPPFPKEIECSDASHCNACDGTFVVRRPIQ